MNEPIAKPRAPVKRPGAARPAPVKRKPRKPNWIYLAGCVILMGVFFMPWFSTPRGSVLGYEIPYWTPRVLNALYAPPNIVLVSNSLWALAFVGVFAFFGLGMELSALPRHKNQWWLRALTAVSPLAAILFILGLFLLAGSEEVGTLAYLMSQADPATAPETQPGGERPGLGAVIWALMKISGFGMWLTALGMLLCGVSVWVHPGRRKKQPAAPPVEGQGSGAATA